MPAENRRIVGPEISQPVALRQRKRHPKPLVIMATCFLKQRHLSGLLTLRLFPRGNSSTQINGDSLRQDGRKVNELRSVCKLKLILKILTSILPSLWRIIAYNASEWVSPMSQVAKHNLLVIDYVSNLLLIVRYRSKKFVFYFHAFAFAFERLRLCLNANAIKCTDQAHYLARALLQ